MTHFTESLRMVTKWTFESLTEPQDLFFVISELKWTKNYDFYVK